MRQADAPAVEICPACRNVIEPGCEDKVCRSCSLFSGCRKVRCPRCGYEWPREPRFVRWLREHLTRNR